MQTWGWDEQAVYDVLENSWFKLRDVRCERDMSEGWRFQWRKLESYTLFVSLSAKGLVTVNGHVRTLRPGVVVVCEPGQEVAAKATMFDDRGIYIIQFDAGIVHSSRHSGPKGLFPADGELAFSPAPADLALCESMLRYWEGGSRLERLRSQAAFHEWLYCLLQNDAAESKEDWKTGLAWAKLYMEQHFDADITIERLAGAVRVSPRHFRRLFKEMYDVSAIDYLTEQRIHQAKIRMEEQSKPLAEIAREVGYENESYFRRMFKRQVGVPPAQYVRNRQLRTAAYSRPNIGQLLPVGIIPHAAPMDQYWTDYYRRKFRFEVIVTLGHRYEFNREALRLFRPDFIVGIDAFVAAEEQQRLTAIAPTLFVPWLTADWRTHLRLAAAFLDRAAEAENWLRSYEREADVVAEQLLRKMEQEAVVIVMVDKDVVYRWTGGQAGTLDNMPFAPRRIAGPVPAFAPTDRERWNDGNADRILVLLSEDVRSAATWRDLQRMEIWQQMARRGTPIQLIRLGPDFDYAAFNHRLILEQFKALTDGWHL